MSSLSNLDSGPRGKQTLLAWSKRDTCGFPNGTTRFSNKTGRRTPRWESASARSVSTPVSLCLSSLFFLSFSPSVMSVQSAAPRCPKCAAAAALGTTTMLSRRGVLLRCDGRCSVFIITCELLHTHRTGGGHARLGAERNLHELPAGGVAGHVSASGFGTWKIIPRKFKVYYYLVLLLTSIIIDQPVCFGCRI